MRAGNGSILSYLRGFMRVILSLVVALLIAAPTVVVADTYALSDDYLNALVQAAADPTPAPNYCNGGSCQAGPNQTVACPTSGGQYVCKAGEECSCYCSRNAAGGVTATNKCIPAVVVPATPGAPAGN